MNSKIILCSGIKMDRNYNNVLSYSESDMVTLCNNNKIASDDYYNFIRPDKNRISTHFNYAQCLQANYIAFQNSDYSNKWFFAWIDDVIHKNNGCTEITFTIDSWSTWFDYWTKKPCYIIREHVNDDTVGLHTVPENLTIGDLISDSSVNLFPQGSYYWIVISCNWDPATNVKTVGLGAYADYVQGSRWFAWSINRENFPNNMDTTIADINTWIEAVASDAMLDYITGIFIVPDQAFNARTDFDDFTPPVLNGHGQKYSHEEKNYKSVWRSFSDYTAKNNKLYCYPTSFVRLSNRNGVTNDYKIEDFIEYETDPITEETTLTDYMTFEIQGIPCEGYAGRAIPLHYQKEGPNFDESVPMAKYPTLSWNGDSYTNWLATQGINTEKAKEGDFFGGVMTPKFLLNTITNAIGMTSNPITGVINSSTAMLNQSDSAFMQPNKGSVNNSGDINFAFNNYGLILSHMRAKKEYLEIIDDYYSKYGYKINRTKEPNITGRTNWNYVEIGSSEEIGYGQVPSRDMENINNACRKGVTIWHNHTNLGNFSLNNSIV